MALVVIPALAPTLDKSLKGDRSLCPVRALHYYLDKTSDLRQNKELVFVSFKKGFDKDISTATVSSWIKQTVILCYELSDQQALTLHQVKAHDVRAFAASKAFQSGISIDLHAWLLEPQQELGLSELYLSWVMKRLMCKCLIGGSTLLPPKSHVQLHQFNFLPTVLLQWSPSFLPHFSDCNFCCMCTITIFTDMTIELACHFMVCGVLTCTFLKVST